MLTQAELKGLLVYDPTTGVFTRVGGSRTDLIGTEAGRINTNGHRQIGVNGKFYMAHRLAWLYVYGEFPELCLDHINGNPDDNRIENLRLATHKQNMENQKLHTNNESGHRGIHWHKVNKKWVAYLNHNGVRKYLGSFIDLDKAVNAAKTARDSLFTHNKTEYAA